MIIIIIIIIIPSNYRAWSSIGGDCCVMVNIVLSRLGLCCATATVLSVVGPYNWLTLGGRRRGRQEFEIQTNTKPDRHQNNTRDEPAAKQTNKQILIYHQRQRKGQMWLEVSTPQYLQNQSECNLFSQTTYFIHDMYDDNDHHHHFL